MMLRSLVLLVALLAGAAPAAVPAADPVPVVQATVRLESGLTAQVEDRSFVVREGDATILSGRLGSWAEATGFSGIRPLPAARAFTWNYPHLQEIVFVDLSAKVEAIGLPALTFDVAEGFEHAARYVTPHDGMGGHDAVQVDLWQRHDERGYVALVRLDAAGARRHDQGAWSFEAPAANSTLRWPLAVIRARTAGELDARIGQALLAFDGAGTRTDPRDWWRIPTMCGICQQQRVLEVELDLQDRDSSLLLHVRTRVEHPDHAWAVAEGMQIEGQALAPFLTGEQGNQAWFVVPYDQPLADALVAVAVNGDARVQARLCNGREAEVPVVRVLLDPDFQERLYEKQRPKDEPDWPNHLSAELVNSWPNPFRQSTTIEITVPATIEEAFDLEPELLARVEPTAEPPFGRNPSVQVKVFNVSGQLVNILDSGQRSAGRFTVSWNGQDLQGQNVASGAYYIHVAMDEWSVTRRVLLLRN